METSLEIARRLMDEFAERTGIGSGKAPQRYLWTDAYAVCNYISLAEGTGEAAYSEVALQLIEQVHHTLGRHRDDDSRSGWLSGLDEDAGEDHPTAGGLRIGKPRPERSPGEALDERAEWDRDGQYFHYLTKWMHALDCAARHFGDAKLNRWARELAKAAAKGFIVRSESAGPRMYWKMSIDLSRPLVASMGQHDPLDGYVTALELQATAAGFESDGAGRLEREIDAYAEMCLTNQWLSSDPLGIGGLLGDACRVHQLMEMSCVSDEQLLFKLLRDGVAGLRHFVQTNNLQRAAEHRLGFRELGLTIGLHAVERLSTATARPDTGLSAPLLEQIESFDEFIPIAAAIETFWLDPNQRSASTWTGHRDINEVMLATSLAPEGFLRITPR